MTAKEFLGQAYRLDQRINSKLQQIDSLRGLTQKVTQSYDSEVVSRTRNVTSLEDAIIRLMEAEEELNQQILDTMAQYFPQPWVQERRGIRIGQRVYLEHGDKFDWPDLSAQDGGERVFCYGLRDQLGVLCDGTVVPCCLDHEGDLALGNLLETPLEQILESPRAQAIYRGFSDGKAAEELCRKCGYARRFQR